MGYLFLTRPLDGLTIGTLTGLWTLSFLKKGSNWAVIVGYSTGCIVIGALIFPFNSFLTGDPFLTPMNQYIGEFWYPGANRLGFGKDIGPPNQWNRIDLYPGHNVREALVNFQQNSYSMNFELFGWGIGSLSIFLAHILWGRWTRHDICMLAIIAVITSVYSLYWFSGSFYIGPRYWFMTFLPIISITASGIRTLICKFRSIQDVTLPIQKFGFIFIILCVVSMSSFLTWRGISRYYEFRGFHTDYRDILAENNLDNSLIFVKSGSKSDFASAFMYNSPGLSGSGPIFARDLGSKSNRAIAGAFPDRSIYYINGRADNVSHAHIVLGPVSRSTLR